MARNRPTDIELIEAVAEFLAEEVEPEIEASDVRFRLRIANNVLGIVLRECRSAKTHDDRERAALQSLLTSDVADLAALNETLCQRIRRGDFDDRHDELLQALTRITLDKLSIDNPRYSTYRDLESK